jgi:kynurenine formamidase
MTHHDNWRRWGADDRRGALNLATPDAALAALSLPRKGGVYSLAHVVDGNTPVSARRTPIQREVKASTNRRGTSGSFDDQLVLHAHAGTHIDSLSHYWSSAGQMYNGHGPEHVGSQGSAHLGIHNMAGLLTEAVYLDLRGLCPGGRAGHGFEITVGHLEGALAEHGLALGAGQVLLLRTGWEQELEGEREIYTWGEPGIGRAAAEWLARQDIVAVGADNWGVEAVPPRTRGEGLVVHSVLLNRYGIYLIENLSFAGIPEDVMSGTYLFVLAPLRIAGGSGSPVNPLLIT